MLLKKESRIGKTKPNQDILTFKTNKENVELLLSISNFYILKTAQADKSFHESNHWLEITEL